MYTLTMNLTSNEWVKVKQEATRLWADERMSTGELARRFVLAGVEALKNVASADLKRKQYQFQATMTVAGPDGDKPRGTPWD